MNNYRQQEYKLNSVGIDDSIRQAVSFLSERDADKKNILRIRLGLEEALLDYRDAFGEDEKFLLKMTYGWGQTHVSVSVAGRMLDPFVKNGTGELDSSFIRAALAGMGEMPVWKYSRGINTISYTVKKKTMSSWAQLLLALFLAVVCGLILKSIPQNITGLIHQDILTPLLNTFMNFLSAIAGPMIFLAVVWGIYSIGDVSAFSVVGKKLLFRLLFYIVFLTAAAGILMTPVFLLKYGSAKVGNGFSEIFEMVLNIIPGNIIRPFADGNTLQILFIGIVMGVSMIIIGEKTQTVALFAEQLNYIVQLIMDFISRLVPFFVFGSLLDVILNNQLSDIKVSTKLFAVNALGCLLFLIFYLVIVGIRMRVSPFIFLKKGLQTLIIGLTTASSAAAFSTSLETCHEKYGIEKSFTDFGVPFSQVIYKPSVSILYFSSALFAAEAYGVPVSASWFAAAFLMSTILSVATPPIPGGTLASISVLFTQLGLPQQSMAVILALNIILDFLETPTDIFGGHAMLILTARKLGLIDRDVLKNP